MRSSERGNAVIFILLAVALFAGLAYSFMRGAKSGQGNLTAGQAKLAAQEIITASQEISRAVDRLRQRGCSELEISIQRDWNGNGSIQDAAGDHYNPIAPVDGSCDMFETNGANISYSQIQGIDWRFSGSNNIEGVGCDSGIACTELVFVMKDLPLVVCEALNQSLGISTGTMFTDGNGMEGFVHFEGAFTNLPSIGDSDPTLKGQTAACYHDNGGTPTGYVYYNVLLAR